MKKVQWRRKNSKDLQGVLVGCDAGQEWLLSWWWNHYRERNDFPVAFVDFGMSPAAQKWCKERGELIPLKRSNRFSLPKQKVDRVSVRKWESTHGEGVWQARENWFKKPFALLQTPFQNTVWMDLDCEVLDSIAELFKVPEIALSRETEASQKKEENSLLEGEVLYNSGVIAYKKGAALIQLWAKEALKSSGAFCGDQELLSRLIFKNKMAISEIPDRYNWRMSQGFNLHAAIVHWAGVWGKNYIRQHGGLADDLRSLSFKL